MFTYSLNTKYSLKVKRSIFKRSKVKISIVKWLKVRKTNIAYMTI